MFSLQRVELNGGLLITNVDIRPAVPLMITQIHRIGMVARGPKQLGKTRKEGGGIFRTLPRGCLFEYPLQLGADM